MRFDLIDALFSEGRILSLWGNPGVGKTNVTVTLMYYAVQRGYVCYTITPFFKPNQIKKAIDIGLLPPKKYLQVPNEIKTVSKVSEIIQGLSSIKKGIVFLDEASFIAPSAHATSSKARQTKSLAYIIRKLNSSMLVAAQSSESVVPDLRENLIEFEFEIKKRGLSKNSQRDLLLKRKASSIYNEEVKKGNTFVTIARFNNIPSAPYPYDTKAVPSFVFDINLMELFDRIGNLNSIEMREELPDILKELIIDSQTEKRSGRKNS